MNKIKEGFTHAKFLHKMLLSFKGPYFEPSLSSSVQNANQCCDLPYMGMLSVIFQVVHRLAFGSRRDSTVNV